MESMSLPLVSVVMLSYNHQCYINEAIESVLNQSFPDWELIIIDDASTDGSQQVIRNYLDDERLRPIFHESNKGIPASANEGIDAARGKYIAFLDSDDVWKFDKLSKQLDVLNKDEDLVVWSEGDIIDENSTVLVEKFTEIHHAQNKTKSGNIFDSLIDNNFIFQSSFIIKTKNLKGIRLNEGLKYLNDYQQVVELATKYKYYFIPEPLAKYRMHNKNTVRRDANGYITDEIKLRTYFIQNFSEKLSSDLIRLNHARVVELLDARIMGLSAQNTELSSQIAEMRQSILWQLIMIYQNGFVERFLPMNSQRRKYYDLSIKGARVLANEGASKFCTKFYNFMISSRYQKSNKELFGNNINYRKDLLEEAYHRFDFEPSTLKCLKMSSNSVYECQVNREDRILRILMRSLDWIPLVKGEIDWINYLGDNGIFVCRAMPSSNGNNVEVITTSNNSFLLCSFVKARGHKVDRNNSNEWNDSLFQKWGATLGKMHHLTKNYTVRDSSTKRKGWNYGPIFDPEFSLGPDKNRILKIWRELIDELHLLPKNKDCYGLVHNDLHHLNFNYDKSAITVFDFEDCGYNWFACDIANSLYHAITLEEVPYPRKLRNIFAEGFMRNFFIGYYQENKLDDYWIELLPKFLKYIEIYIYLKFYSENRNLREVHPETMKILESMEKHIESRTPIVDIDFMSCVRGIELNVRDRI
jgi:Ser/Thr protein kinase RdoA (MazF antagonist)